MRITTRTMKIDECESEETLAERGEERADSSKATMHITEKKFTRKFIDNKIDLLEKILSTTQRDLVYLNLARKELCVRQNMIHELTEPTKESNKAFPQNPQPVLENPLEMVWPR